VVGWYEGHPSSSDDSHLWHLHVGLWTGSCDDAAQLKLLGDIITGTEPAPKREDEMIAFTTDGTRYWRCNGVTCVPVDPAALEPQTFIYKGGKGWETVGQAANLANPVLPAIQAVPGGKTYVKLFSQDGTWGEVIPAAGSAGPATLVPHNHAGGETGPAVAAE
jgi:hypothetical protein